MRIVSSSRSPARVVADTREALTLREASYPAVQYIPRKDVDMTLLERTAHVTYCPYKGDCAYYSIPAGGERSINAVWTYEAPYAAVAAIKDHLAFYPDRVGRDRGAAERLTPIRVASVERPSSCDGFGSGAVVRGGRKTMHRIRCVGPRHAVAPQRARRFSRRNSMNACSGTGTCRRLG